MREDHVIALPSSVSSVLPIVVGRVEYNLVRITFDGDRDPFSGGPITYRLPAGLVIDILCTVLYRLITQDILRFDGMGPRPRHAKDIIESVGGSLLREFGDRCTTSHHTRLITEVTLLRFLHKQHAIVFGHASLLTRSGAKRPRASNIYHASLQ